MDILLNYGNSFFWIGLLITCFLAGCEFFCNDMSITLAKYKTFTFAKHPRLQKICRLLFVITLILALFAKSGAHWQTSTDFFTNLMVVLLIYFVVCYPLVVCLLWAASILWRFMRLFFAAVYWIVMYVIDWINGK